MIESKSPYGVICPSRINVLIPTDIVIAYCSITTMTSCTIITVPKNVLHRKREVETCLRSSLLLSMMEGNFRENRSNSI